MRQHLFVAAFLASTTLSPASAQEVGAVTGSVGQTQAVVGRVADTSEDRVARGDRSWRTGGTLGRAVSGGNDRMDRDVPQRPQPQFQPQFQAPAQPQQQPDWRQPRQPPIVTAAPRAPVTENRDWHDSGGNRGDGNARPTPPVVAGGDWRRNDRDRDGRQDWGRARDWRSGDRAYDGGRFDRDRNNDGYVDRRWDRNGDGIRDNGTWRNDRQNWGRPTWNNNGRWNHQWRNDNRYDWQRYRSANRDVFRQPRYYAPFGYRDGYQRFGVGIFLDSTLFGPRYRVSDAWRYRLPVAQWPYEWVRYYDDVLLVDTRDGYVVDVIYRFFW